MTKLQQKRLFAAIAVTDAYRTHENDHPAIREAHGLRAQYPAILGSIRDEELFAGRCEFGYAGYKVCINDGESGFFCDIEAIDELLAGGVEPEYASRLNDLKKFWEMKTVTDILLKSDRSAMSEGIFNMQLIPGDGRHWQRAVFVGNYMTRMAEIGLNFELLVKLGVPGLKLRVEKLRDSAADDDGRLLCEGALMALDIFSHACIFYRDEAKKLAKTADNDRKADLLEMARILETLPGKAPETFREGLQLVWLWAMLATVDNYGRMDLYLGDLLAADLDSGRIGEREALRLLRGFYHMVSLENPGAGRIIVGGKGRPNEKNADCLALLVMEALRDIEWSGERMVSPQVSLRTYAGGNPVLYEKAVEIIALGYSYPILYNDDIIISNIANAFHVSEKEAEQYIMSNCGEYAIDHRTFGSPNISIAYPKLLEATLWNGFDPVSGKAMGLKTGEFTAFETFDSFFEAYKLQIQTLIDVLMADALRALELTGELSRHLFASMLFDHCMESGRGFPLGAKYLGIAAETHGAIGAADSLHMIRQLVFEQKLITQQRLLDALAANFEGFEAERKLIDAVPKYGNDDDRADEIAFELFKFIQQTVAAKNKELGLHFCVNSHISVDVPVYVGKIVGATPDGRCSGEPFTNGCNPLPGNDRNGVTALMNSMLKLKPGSGGQVNHLRFGGELFRSKRPVLDALIESFFARGGEHLCIEAIERGTLEAALREPEKYPNLTVRVGGYSARFVQLPKDIQMAMLDRTVY